MSEQALTITGRLPPRALCQLQLDVARFRDVNGSLFWRRGEGGGDGCTGHTHDGMAWTLEQVKEQRDHGVCTLIPPCSNKIFAPLPPHMMMMIVVTCSCSNNMPALTGPTLTPRHVHL